MTAVSSFFTASELVVVRRRGWRQGGAGKERWPGPSPAASKAAKPRRAATHGGRERAEDDGEARGMEPSLSAAAGIKPEYGVSSRPHVPVNSCLPSSAGQHTFRFPSDEQKASVMAYVILKAGGKQYKVAEGDIIDVDKLDAEAGQETTFSEVLFHADGDKPHPRQPAHQRRVGRRRGRRAAQGPEGHRVQVPPPQGLPPHGRPSPEAHARADQEHRARRVTRRSSLQV